MRTARLYVPSHAEARVSYLPSPRPIGRPRSVANPGGTGEMRVKGGCIDPLRRDPFDGVTQAERGAETLPLR